MLGTYLQDLDGWNGNKVRVPCNNFAIILAFWPPLFWLLSTPTPLSTQAPRLDNEAPAKRYDYTLPLFKGKSFDARPVNKGQLTYQTKVFEKKHSSSNRKCND